MHVKYACTLKVHVNIKYLCILHDIRKNIISDFVVDSDFLLVANDFKRTIIQLRISDLNTDFTLDDMSAIKV